MSPAPEGAQLSEDGFYWWDGAQWQPVDQPGGSGTGGGGGGQGAQGTAIFAFGETALGRMTVNDENDDPLPQADKQTKVSFSVFNIGTAEGTATVTISVDGTDQQTWTSDIVPAQQSAGPPDGFVHNCGAFPAGDHTFRAVLSPSTAGQDTAENTVSLS